MAPNGLRVRVTKKTAPNGIQVRKHVIAAGFLILAEGRYVSCLLKKMRKKTKKFIFQV